MNWLNNTQHMRDWQLLLICAEWAFIGHFIPKMLRK